MGILKVLTTDMIRLELRGESKVQVIESLIDILMETGKIKNRHEALTAVMEREMKMSTGIENGVAIPHGKTDTVDELIACVALKKEGLDFDSLDGEKSRIFIMTLSPRSSSGPHIQFLAEVSRLLQDERCRRDMLKAESEQEVLDLLF